jgi:hypothetical protein
MIDLKNLNRTLIEVGTGEPSIAEWSTNRLKELFNEGKEKVH